MDRLKECDNIVALAKGVGSRCIQARVVRSGEDSRMAKVHSDVIRIDPAEGGELLEAGVTREGPGRRFSKVPCTRGDVMLAERLGWPRTAMTRSGLRGETKRVEDQGHMSVGPGWPSGF